MHLKSWVLSDVGLKRDSNQDSFLIDDQLKLFVVADGMGGHQGGEVASQLAVQTVHEIIASHSYQQLVPRDLIRQAYHQASERIFARSQEDKKLEGMGTTMVLAYEFNNSLFIGNVGDSRCYLIRGKKIWQLTEDHSLLNEQIRAGILDVKNAETFSAKNVITRSVGYEPQVSCDVLERDLQEGDHFLLCSDGLHGLVKDHRIMQILADTPASKVPDRLIQEAKANGGDDNVTVLFIKVEA